MPYLYVCVCVCVPYFIHNVIGKINLLTPSLHCHVPYYITTAVHSYNNISYAHTQKMTNEQSYTHTQTQKVDETNKKNSLSPFLGILTKNFLFFEIYL